MYNWITTRKIARTDGTTYPVRAAQTVDAVVAKWIPATAALLACFVTPARAKLDSRYYEAPNYPVRAVQTVDATVRTWIPTFDNELAQYRTGQRSPLDVRTYEWSPEFVSIPRLVDPTIAKWEPAFDHEHTQYVTGACPPLDVRRYDWDGPESGWIQSTQTIAPTVAQTWPAFQETGLSARTADRARLDIRSYDWAIGEEAWIGPTQAFTVADSAAVFADDGGRTADGPKLDVRRYEWAPEFVSIPRLIDPTVAAWIPALADDGGRIQARPSLDVRQYDWVSGEESWIQATQTAQGPTVAQMAPAWISQAQNFRISYRRYFTVSTIGTDQGASGGAQPTVTPPTTAQTVPAWAFDGDRTNDRAKLDVRLYEWSVWVRGIAAPAATVAQTAPAWANSDQFRTRSAPTLDLSRTQSIPDIFGVPDDWITWVPNQDDGTPGRTRDRAQLDVRAYEWSQPAWIFKAIPASTATVPQQVPAWADDGGRLTARPSLDVRFYDWAPEFGWVQPVANAAIVPFGPIFSSELASFRTRDHSQLDVRTEWSPSQAWIFAQLPAVPDATVAQRSAIWPLSLTFRTRERGGDVRNVDTQPEFSWVNPVIDASIAKLAPIFDAELASFRTADDPRLDVRTYRWAPDAAAWELVNFAPPATQAQIWPALLENLGTQYQTPARAKLDVRTYDWQPEFTWTARVVDATVAKLAPVFSTLIQSSPRTPDHARLDVLTLTDQPVDHAWFSALTLTGVLPYPLATTPLNQTLYTLVYLDTLYTTTDL